MTEPTVPWWGLLSATASPVLLIGGWTVAAARQVGGFDPVVETISALAARGADDRWIMTTGLAGLGVCHVVTALALRPAAAAGRVVLAAGGIATVLVAAFPLPADDSGSTAHGLAAGVGFLTLAGWPAVAVRRSSTAPIALRPAVALPATAVLFGLVVWFGGELIADSGRVGLAERAAAGAQAIWPLAAAVVIRWQSANARRRRQR